MKTEIMTEYEQHARETLPEGYVFLGRGGEFTTNGNFLGMSMFDDDFHEWDDEESYMLIGADDKQFYAAATNSSVAILNRQSMAGLPAFAKTEIIRKDDIPEMFRNAPEPHNTFTPLFPEDAEKRKQFPVGTFITDYFPHAIAALAHHSYVSQQQHGEPGNGKIMEWLKDKSIGDGNQTMRHYMEGHKLAALWRMAEEVQRDIETVGSTEAYLEREGY